MKTHKQAGLLYDLIRLIHYHKPEVFLKYYDDDSDYYYPYAAEDMVILLKELNEETFVTYHLQSPDDYSCLYIEMY